MLSSLPVPVADSLAFDWDRPSTRQSLLIRADKLDEYGMADLANLIRLQLDGESGNVDVLTDIRMLRELLQIKASRRYTRTTLNVNLKTTALRMIDLEEPIGDLYTKLTVHPANIDSFDDVIKNMPILHLVFACVDYRFDLSLLISKLEYRWLAKCETIEFNNLNANMHEFTQMFKGTAFRPVNLIISGRRIGVTPTPAQVKMFKMIMPHEMKQLRTVVWGAETFNLR